MKISLDWLKQYTDFDLSAEELAHKLTMAGLEVENIAVSEAGHNSGIVVGEILAVEKHPDADKLSVCRVNTGKEELQVVCGAPNVAPGLKAPFAPVDALVSGHRIKPVVLRGVSSQGMICSERELGISDRHEGIMILKDQSLVPGTPFQPDSVSDDAMLEIDITPNRPDCLCHIGIAREVSAFEHKELHIPRADVPESDVPVTDVITIAIEDTEACPRYSARVISGVTVRESPQWLQKRLLSVGIRPINAIVDVTNFVLMETGHPLHAFDYDEIRDRKIIVRKAGPGETFTTLDDTVRTLSDEDLLICDGKRPVALAGVMGGSNSEISGTTRNVLLESAYFDPMTIRKTAKRLGLSTEASQRYERGADPENTVLAVNRAAGLIMELAGGTAAQGIADVYPRPVAPLQITLRPARLDTVIGMSIPHSKISSILTRLGMAVHSDDDGPFLVTVPSFRPDITREIDLIEEVLRHYGYNEVPPALTVTLPLHDNRSKSQEFRESLRDILAGTGLFEILSSSLVPREHAELYCPDNKKPMGLLNPLNPDTAFLRTSLIPGLISVVTYNINRSQQTCRFFEIGTTFIPGSGKDLPEETVKVSGILSGKANTSPYWSGGEEVDFFHLKGLIESFLTRSYIRDFSFQESDHSLFSYGYAVTVGPSSIGYFGLLAGELQHKWDTAVDLYAFEFDTAAMLGASSGIACKPIIKFPAVKRDVAFIVDTSDPAGAVAACIRKAGGRLLQDVSLFDLYTGESIPENKKSLAFSLQFSAKDRTLREQDVEPAVAKIITEVCKLTGAELRS